MKWSSVVLNRLAMSLTLYRVSMVAEGFLKLVEEDHHDKVMRVTHEKGIDFHPFKKIPPAATSKM